MKNKVIAIENSEATVENEIKALLGDEYTNFIHNTNNNLSKIDYRLYK